MARSAAEGSWSARIPRRASRRARCSSVRVRESRMAMKATPHAERGRPRARFAMASARRSYFSATTGPSSGGGITSLPGDGEGRRSVTAEDQGPGPEAGWAKLGAQPGLCRNCRHARLNETRRGTAYLRCGRSAWDERLVRYPGLPVLDCVGFEARDQPGAAGWDQPGAAGWRTLGGTASGGRGGRMEGAGREAVAREVAARMATAAAGWLDSLDPGQRAVATGSAPSPDAGPDAERRRWFYTPTDHGGLTLGAQRPAQQRLAHRLVASGLSTAGYVTVATIVGLDNVLDQVEGWSVNWGRERGRDPALYYLRVFGEPGGAAPWGWRFGGHHVSLNNLIAGGMVRAVTPCFLGADPAVSPLLGSAPLRPLGGAEDLARDLVRSLDPGQGARAILLDRAPSDIVGGNRSRLADGDQMMYLSELWRRPFTEPELAGPITRMDADNEAASGYDAGDYQRLALTSAPKGLPARDLDGG